MVTVPIVLTERSDAGAASMFVVHDRGRV